MQKQKDEEEKNKFAEQDHYRKTWDTQIDIHDSTKKVEALF